MKQCFWFLRQRGFQYLLIGLAVSLLLVTVFFPIVIAALWSLVDPKTGWYYPYLIPPRYSLYFWQWAFRVGGVTDAALTSLGIAAATTAVCALLALPTAFVLGRYRFPGKRIIDFLILSPVIVPTSAVAVSLGAIFIRLGLAQTMTGVVLAHAVVYVPYMIRTCTSAFGAVPQDVIDAARNLGARPLQLIRHVLLPLVMPGLFAGALFTFIFSLEEFTLSFIVGSPGVVTLPIKLYSFLGDQFIRSGAAVVSLMIMAPTVVLMLIAERFMKTEYLSAGFGKMQ